MLREKQGLRFNQNQAQIQAASQISDLIFLAQPTVNCKFQENLVQKGRIQSIKTEERI